MPTTFTAADLPIYVLNEAGEKQVSIELGAAEGRRYLTVYIHNGDLAGLRNIQGGSIDTGQSDDINLDIASGNAQTPGWVNFTPDVGKGTRWLDAKGHETGRVTTAAQGTTPRWTFTAPTRIRQLWVPNGKGGWRRAAV